MNSASTSELIVDSGPEANTEAAEGSYLGCLCDLQSLLEGSLSNLEKKQTECLEQCSAHNP